MSITGVVLYNVNYFHACSDVTWRHGRRISWQEPRARADLETNPPSLLKPLLVHQLEPVDVDQPLVGDLQVRDHRQGQERHLQERLVQGRAHGHDGIA